MATPLVSALDTVGRIEGHVQAIANLEKRLGRIPLWLPSGVLSRQANEARRMIQKMQARPDGRLVATLIGPSGAGKSTLFNALAGADHLSPMGRRRPTTRDLVVLATDPSATRDLLGPLGHQRIQFASGPESDRLEHLILVDTPDTDTTKDADQMELLRQVVERSDVLICVFDGQNPKRRDHADFMAPLVRCFSGDSLVAVLNKCDRHDADELTRTIGPDFADFLQQAWPSRPESVLLVSARRHLREPRWDPQAGPRHDLDQFDWLANMIRRTLNRPGAGSDRRIANAAQIHDYLAKRVRETAAAQADTLATAADRIAAAEHHGFQAAMSQLRADDRRQIFGIQVRLYQALAQRWIGPVGWMIAIWSRLLVFGSGLTALVRLGNPIRLVWGAVASWRRYRQSRSAIASVYDPARIDDALNRLRRSILTHWPDIANGLVRAGFDPACRHLEELEPRSGDVRQALDDLWSDALDRQINRQARGLSHPLLQLTFNLPGVVLMGYVGWLTARGFFSGRYLAADFFLHAGVTIALVLLLVFFVLQVVVRIAVGRDRLGRRAFEEVEKGAKRQPLMATGRIADQVARVLDLARSDPAGRWAAPETKGSADDPDGSGRPEGSA